MLLTSSGDRDAEEGGGVLVLVGDGAALAVAFAATIPGARFARGTLRGRPALVVCTEAAWTDAGVSGGVSAGVGGGWPAVRLPARLAGLVGGGGVGAGPDGAGAAGEGGAVAPGVLVGSGPTIDGVPVRRGGALLGASAGGRGASTTSGSASARGASTTSGSASARGPATTSGSAAAASARWASTGSGSALSLGVSAGGRSARFAGVAGASIGNSPSRGSAGAGSWPVAPSGRPPAPLPAGPPVLPPGCWAA